MRAWDVIDCEDDMNVIISTLAFKLKWYSDGHNKKFKDILCASGYMQLGWIDFFKTNAPFDQCTTISFIPILEILLQLKSDQGDITAEFLHEKLEENKKVFIDMPKIFEQYDKRGNWRVLRLKKTLYGIFQIPRYFW